MTPNVGDLDRALRMFVGLLLVAIGVYFKINWLLVVALVPILTGAFKFCPLYTVLKIDTKKGCCGCCCKSGEKK